MMDKDTFFGQKNTLNIAGRSIDLSVPKVMGILNLTPDSFFDGGKYTVPELAIAQAEKLLEAGAHILDIGAYSSRPNAKHITAGEERERLTPVIKAISKHFPDALMSVDTFRADVAESAINDGAHIINDIAAGDMDPLMFATVARLQVPYVMMHMQGTPQTMQQNPHYTNLMEEVITYFNKKVIELRGLGAKDIVIDPGFGFGKTVDHNYQLLNQLQQLHTIGLPMLVGVSRKSMIYKLLGITAPEALNGTTVINTIALLKGASILRVHDVKEARECVALVQKMHTA